MTFFGVTFRINVMESWVLDSDTDSWAMDHDDWLCFTPDRQNDRLTRSASWRFRSINNPRTRTQGLPAGGGAGRGCPDPLPCPPRRLSVQYCNYAHEYLSFFSFYLVQPTVNTWYVPSTGIAQKLQYEYCCRSCAMQLTVELTRPRAEPNTITQTKH